MARKQAAAPQKVVRQADAIYSEAELGEILHTSQQVLRGLRQSGKLRYLTVGRRIVYPDQYLQEYIDRAGVLHTDQAADRIALVQRR